MRTNRPRSIVLPGLALLFSFAPAILAAEAPAAAPVVDAGNHLAAGTSCGTEGDAEARLADCRSAHQEGATFCLGVKADRRQSTETPQRAELNLVTRVGLTTLWKISPFRADSGRSGSTPGTASIGGGAEPPVIEIDLGKFLKADDSAEVPMSTRIPDSVLPRGYRRMQETAVATPSAYWTGTDPYVWAPTPSDVDLLLAAPIVVPGPCPAR